MGGREFCALLSLLRTAGPALPPGELPTLAAFSALAASFAPAPAAATGLIPNTICTFAMLCLMGLHAPRSITGAPHRDI